MCVCVCLSLQNSVNDYVPNDADFSTQATVYTDLNSLLVLVNERIVSQLVPSAAPAPYVYAGH